MRRQPNSLTLDVVYREFSRQHYIKYRSQFPKLREPEIVSRIIKDWDKMENSQKEALGAMYVKKKYIRLEDDPSHSSNPSL